MAGGGARSWICHARDGDAGESSGEHRIANNQVDLLAKQGAASGGPPQALIEAYLERTETTRRHHEMATEILEERDHLEDIASQAEQEPGITDGVRDVQKPVFFQAMERRALPTGGWVDVKPKMTIDAESSVENKNELISARVRNKAVAGGELVEVAWDWEQILLIERNRQRWVPAFPAAFQAYWNDELRDGYIVGDDSSGHVSLHWSPPPGSAWRKKRPGNGESLAEEH